MKTLSTKFALTGAKLQGQPSRLGRNFHLARSHLEAPTELHNQDKKCPRSAGNGEDMSVKQSTLMAKHTNWLLAASRQQNHSYHLHQNQPGKNTPSWEKAELKLGK